MVSSGSFAWAMMTGSTAFLVGVCAPILGRFADLRGHHLIALRGFTLASVFAVAALWFVCPDPSYIAFALGVSALVIFCTEISFIYYNSLLIEIAAPTDFGRLSGYGWGAGYIAAVVALILVLLVFILPDPPLFGLEIVSAEPLRLSMVFTSLWLLIWAFPALLFLPPIKPQPTARDAFLTEVKQSVFIVLSIEGMWRFLLARLAWSDALVTLFAFGGIFASVVLGFSETEILLFAISLNITAGLGAFVGGWLDHQIGSLRLIRISLAVMFLAGCVCVSTDNQWLFWISSLILGFFVGPCQAASRTWVASRAPKHYRASVFGLLSLSGRITSFIGPLAYGGLIYFTGNERAGMIIVLILFAIGFMFLPKVPDKIDISKNL